MAFKMPAYFTYNAVLQFKLHAGIAQLVERNLAKVEVASSSLVSRSNTKAPRTEF